MEQLCEAVDDEGYDDLSLESLDPSQPLLQPPIPQQPPQQQQQPEEPFPQPSQATPDDQEVSRL